MSPVGAVVESQVPGRVRFRFPREQRSSDILEEAASVLGGVEGVLDVLSNTDTGSLLVLHDMDQLDGEDLLELAKDAKIVEYEGQKVTQSVDQWPEFSVAARSVMQGFKRFDIWVRDMTNGTIDGKTLIIFLLLGSALSRALLGRKQPPAPWYALMWYGYSAFMQWHKPNGSH